MFCKFFLNATSQKCYVSSRVYFFSLLVPVPSYDLNECLSSLCVSFRGDWWYTAFAKCK